MTKAIFFDIDGTIMDHTGDKSIFHDSTAAALAALQRKGIKVFISTGRGPALLDEIWDMFPFDGFVTFNGQLVLEDKEGEILQEMLEEDLPFDVHADVIRIDPRDFGIWYFDCMDVRERYEGKGFDGRI